MLLVGRFASTIQLPHRSKSFIKDFEGHSLSVSDVIALKRNGEVSVHYVDSIGFKDLQGFLDKQPELPSVLMNLKEKCDAPECNPTVCRKVRDAHEL